MRGAANVLNASPRAGSKLCSALIRPSDPALTSSSNSTYFATPRADLARDEIHEAEVFVEQLLPRVFVARGEAGPE